MASSHFALSTRFREGRAVFFGLGRVSERRESKRGHAFYARGLSAVDFCIKTKSETMAAACNRSDAPSCSRCLQPKNPKGQMRRCSATETYSTLASPRMAAQSASAGHRRRPSVSHAKAWRATVQRSHPLAAHKGTSRADPSPPRVLNPLFFHVHGKKKIRRRPFRITAGSRAVCRPKSSTRSRGNQAPAC
jgi:hypothetical protein